VRLGYAIYLHDIPGRIDIMKTARGHLNASHNDYD